MGTREEPRGVDDLSTEDEEEELGEEGHRNRDENGATQMSTGEELASRQIQIEPKRLYLDLRKNVRGVFLKVAESEITRARSKVIIPGPGFQRFREVLEQFLKTYNNLTNPPTPAPGEPPKVLGMETMISERKKFFFDLLSNSKGCYLKLSQKSMGKKTNVLVPAAGLQIFRVSVMSHGRDGKDKKKKHGARYLLPPLLNGVCKNKNPDTVFLFPALYTRTLWRKF